MTDPPLTAPGTDRVPAASPADGSACERFLEGLLRDLDARRWVLCWHEDGSWRAWSPQPGLRDEILLQLVRARHGTLIQGAELLAVAELGDAGSRLATAGVGHLLLLEAGPAAVVCLEDPDPSRAARIAEEPGALTEVDVAAMLIAERRATQWSVLTSVPPSPGGAQDRQDALLRERARIGSVIHEGITQVLTNVAIQLEVAGHVLDDPEQARTMLTASREAVLEALDSLRTIIFDLTPRDDEWTDLIGGLEQFVGDFGAQWGLTVDLRVEGEAREVDAEVTSLVFAFVQEGLTNARKHAQVDEVAVHVEFLRGRLAVEIADEGVGIDVEDHEERSLRQHQGLKLMESRVRLLDGTFRLDAGAGSGVRLRMEIPA